MGLSDFIMYPFTFPIIGLSTHALFDYVDYDYVIILLSPHTKGPPPSKILDPLFKRGHPLWKSQEIKCRVNQLLNFIGNILYFRILG